MKKIIASIFTLFFYQFCFSQVVDFTYSQTCIGSVPTTLTGSSTYPDSDIQTWEWDINSDGSWDYTGKTVTVYSFISPGVYSIPVTLRITLITGPSFSKMNNVILDPKPTVDFIVSNPCVNDMAIYTSQSNIISGSIVKYIWDFTNDLMPDDSSGSTVNYFCSTIGSINSKLKAVSDKGCKNEIIKTVQIYSKPIASFLVQNNCTNKNTLFINSSSIGFYYWNFGDGTQSTSTGHVSHIYNNSGSYNVTLINTSNGCSDTVTNNISIYQSPTASFSISNICQGQNTMFNPTQIANNYHWDFGDGNQVNTSGSATHTYINSGNYYVTLVASNNNPCNDTITNNININPTPIVSISAPDTMIYGNGQIQLTANGGGNVQWSNGMQNPTISVNTAGHYSVTITDQYGCSGTSSINIYQTGNNNSGSNIIVSSNIITPNGDGVNDYFTINNLQSFFNNGSNGNSGCSVEIYNMWNEIVYSSNYYNNDWNCQYFDGKSLPDGAYYYYIQCGRDTLKGNINILTHNNNNR